MKLSYALVAFLAAASFTAGASAQLKPSSGARLKPPAAAPSAPAATEPAPAGDSASAQKEKAGALAAAGWLVVLDRRDWGTAWEASSSVFRGSVPLDKWMDAIPKVRAPLGNLVERKQAQAVYKTTLQGRPDGDYVTVLFDSKFEHKQVQETVTMVRDTDGQWRVTGYSAG